MDTYFNRVRFLDLSDLPKTILYEQPEFIEHIFVVCDKFSICYKQAFTYLHFHVLPIQFNV
jgi:hypothetical protein